MKKAIKNFVFNAGLLIGAIITLVAIIICGVLGKNFSELWERDDDI